MALLHLWRNRALTFIRRTAAEPNSIVKYPNNYTFACIIVRFLLILLCRFATLKTAIRRIPGTAKFWVEITRWG
jgi:hypothetical protein